MTDPLMCLSLWQPYATLLAIGAKGPETRGWATKHRGRIGIAATKTERPEEAPLVALPVFHDALWPALGFDQRPMPTSVRERLPRGAIVATAELVDCVPIIEYEDPSPEGAHILYVEPYLWVQYADGAHDRIDDRQRFFGEYRSGRWAWLFEDVKPVTERCPWCWGDGGFREDSAVLYGVPGGSDWSDPCPVCNPQGRRTEPLGVGAYGCDPVPVRGMPGLWPWTPEQVAA